MPKKKLYAVKKGKKTGIFQTWDACKASVDGYPGAEYKSFLSREEAEAYLTGANNPLRNTDVESDAGSEENQIVAYVDGDAGAAQCHWGNAGGDVCRQVE